MFKRLVGTALLFGMAAVAPPAFAQGCAQRDVVVDRLQVKFQEGLTAAGLQGVGAQGTAMLEVWSSKTTGTFTVILTNADGVSCVLAAGTDWYQQDPVLTPHGEEG